MSFSKDRDFRTMSCSNFAPVLLTLSLKHARKQSIEKSTFWLYFIGMSGCGEIHADFFPFFGGRGCDLSGAGCKLCWAQWDNDRSRSVVWANSFMSEEWKFSLLHSAHVLWSKDKRRMSFTMYCSFLHYSTLSFLMRNHVLPDNSLCFAQLNLFRLGAVGNLKMYMYGVWYLSFLLYVSNQNYSHVYLMPGEKIRRKSGRNKHTVFILYIYLQGNVI